MPRIAVVGGDLYYEEQGAGVPILGVHGSGSSARLWEAAAGHLAEVGRIVTYDRRGASRSAAAMSDSATSVRRHAEDADRLLAALDAQPAVVIGRSYGATVAIELACRHPESVLALALLEPGPIGVDREYDSWFDALVASTEAAAAERGPDAVGEVVLREVAGAWDELPDAYRAVFTENGASLLAELRGGERLTDLAELEAITVPTVVLAGDDSPRPLRLASEAVAARIPGARARRVEGGHIVDPAHPLVIGLIREVATP